MAYQAADDMAGAGCPAFKKFKLVILSEIAIPEKRFRSALIGCHGYHGSQQ